MLIGVAGPKGSGKTLFAREFAWAAMRSGVKYAVVDAIAMPVKFGIATMLNTNVELLDSFKNDGTLTWSMYDSSQQSVSGGVRIREMMQRYGQRGLVDTFGPDVLMDRAMREYRQAGEHLRILGDVRRKHEAEVIQSAGGKMFYVFRPEAEESGDDHETEDFGWISEIRNLTHVGNIGTIEDLKATAHDMAGAVLSPV